VKEEKKKDLRERTRAFAVIVDEAHSSQSGETTKSLKSVLSAKTLEEAEQEEKEAFSPEEELDNAVLDADLFENEDKFMLHLAQVVRNALGDRASTCVDPRIHEIQDKKICLVGCKRSPIYGLDYS
jgi:hypothetical protein